MKKRKKNLIQESLDLEVKKTPSDKIMAGIGNGTGVLSALLLIFLLIIFLAAPARSLSVWAFIFYPTLILVVVGLVCSIGQLLRNHYFSTITALVLNILCAVALIVIAIVLGVTRGNIFVMPFYFP